MSATPPSDPAIGPSPTADTVADIAWAGRVIFPRSPVELRSTAQCPACLTALHASRCGSCGLDLANPAAIELARLSAEAAALLDARVALIGRIRRQTASAATAAPEQVASSSPADRVPASPTAPTATRPARSGRSGIQIALIVVGISLLSVFAIFGLVYAFVTYGQTVRMLIVAAGTLATLAAAAVLSRRGLTATAEGIAALGTVVLVLDAWALRENDPLGLGAVPELQYWGIALIVVSLIAIGWSRLGELGTPALGTAVLLPLGTAQLAAHLAEPLDATLSLGLLAGASTAVGGIAGFAAALVHPLLEPQGRPALRAIARVLSVTAGGIAAVVAVVGIVLGLDGAPVAALVLGLLLAAVGVLHVVVLSRRTANGEADPLGQLLSAIAAAGAVVAAVVGVTTFAVQLDDPVASVSIPLLATTGLGVLIEVAAHRRPGLATRWARRSAVATAVALAAAGGGIAAVIGLDATVEAALSSFSPLGTTATSTVVAPEPVVGAALGSLALALGFVALGWATIGRLRRRARALTPIMGAIVIALIPLLGTWWALVLAYGLAAIVASIALHPVTRIADRSDRRALVGGLAPIAVGGAFMAVVVAQSVPRAWVVGIAIALIAIAICRALPARLPLRAAAVAVGAALTVASAPYLSADLLDLGIRSSVSAVALALAALVTLTVVVGALHTLERRAAAGTAVLLGALAAMTAVTPETGLPTAVAASIALVALVAAAVRRGPDRDIEALVGRSLIAPIVALLAVALLTAGAAELARTGERSLVVALALIVVAAVSLVAVARPGAAERANGDGRPRIVTDASTGVVLAAALLNSPDDRLRPLVLLAAAVVVLLIAADRDGIVGAGTRRRLLGWGALALAVLALWKWLIDGGATEPEPFVLPVAGALLGIAAWIALTQARRQQGGDKQGSGVRPDSTAPGSPVVSLLVTAAMLIGVVPLALQSGDGPWARGLGAALLGIALVLLAAHRRPELDARFPRLSLGLAASGVIVLGAFAAAQVLALSQNASAASIAVLDQLRAVLVVVTLVAVALAAWFASASRLRDGITAATAGFGAIAAGILALADTTEPVELLTLPLALGLLAIGTLRMEDDDRARSWPWLAPGLLALLAPSLIAISTDDDPLWRVVALGATATAVFIGGVARRLQSPLVIGGTVLLIHLLVQTWPLLEQVGRAVEWWLWLGLAGVAVVALAARYERRLQNAKDLARRIAELR